MKYTSILLLTLTLYADLSAEVILHHSGASNPTSEGWTLNKQSENVSASAVINDLGTGIDGWSIDDFSTETDVLTYTGNITPEQQGRIDANGWKLSILVRVIDLPTLPDGSAASDNSIAVELRTGNASRDFDLVLGYEVNDGNPAIIANGIAHWVDNYALIEVEYTPQVGEWGEPILTVSINGTRRYNYTGVDPNGAGSPYVAWGAFGGATTGHAHWAEVKFEVLPELVPPQISNFEILPNDRLYFRATNIRRGVYYRFEKSTNLIDWDFYYGIRPNESDDIQLYRDMEGDRTFYRVGIK